MPRAYFGVSNFVKNFHLYASTWAVVANIFHLNPMFAVETKKSKGEMSGEYTGWGKIFDACSTV